MARRELVAVGGSVSRLLNPHRIRRRPPAAPRPPREGRHGHRHCGRKLGSYIRKGKRLQSEFNKRSYIEKYIPHIGIALQEILDLTDLERDSAVTTLDEVLQRSRKV